MADSSNWEIQPPGQAATTGWGARDFVRFFIGNLILFVICLAVGVWLGLLVQQLTPRAYQSVGNFVVDELPFNQTTGNIDAETERQLIQTLILSLPSRYMLAAVGKRLDLPAGRIQFPALGPPLKLTGREPKANLQITPVRNSRMGIITATSQDPEFAAQVVNAILDEMQVYNRIGGRLKNLRVSLEFSKIQADGLLKQLTEVSAQRLKLEKEKSALDEYTKQKLPLESFPAFATDATLNNLKTQLILVQSEYDGIASTSVRGSRLVAKKAEMDGLKTQLSRHAQLLASALRSQYEILATQETNLQAQLLAARNEIDVLTQTSARISQSMGDPVEMSRQLDSSPDGPGGLANVIVIIDRATPVLKPIRPKLWLNLALGILFGGALGLGLAALRAVLDTRLKSAQQLERQTGRPCLALLPNLDYLSSSKRSRLVFDHPDYPIGLGYLRTHLLHGHKPNGSRIIGFTPVRPLKNSSNLVADLGILLAQAEKRTLILDLHLQQPAIAGMYGLKIQKELNDWFTSTDPLSDFINYSAVQELAVLSNRSSDRTDLNDLLSRRLLASALLEQLDHWDFILIDAPNILTDWNLMLALPEASPLIVVAEYGRSTGEDVLQTLSHARGPRWNIEGTVMANCPRRLTR